MIRGRPNGILIVYMMISLIENHYPKKLCSALLQFNSKQHQQSQYIRKRENNIEHITTKNLQPHAYSYKPPQVCARPAHYFWDYETKTLIIINWLQYKGVEMPSQNGENVCDKIQVIFKNMK